MFKEPLASTHQNRMNKKKIAVEIGRCAERVVNEEQNDESFIENLLDLYTLHKMAESYEKDEKDKNTEKA